MKSKVKFSLYSKVMTAIVLIVLSIACFATFHEKAIFYILLAIYLILIVFSFFYGVSYIKITQDYILLGSPFKSHKIRLDNIMSVEILQPTMGAIRICGSGGFMGYWGIYREGDIGRYYAFYGKASDCFLVRMKNGDKYLLGCENSEEMVSYINSRLK